MHCTTALCAEFNSGMVEQCPCICHSLIILNSTNTMSLFRTAFTQLRPRLTRTVEEFYDATTKKGEKPFTGRSWRASELRLKSFQDLHKLWFVLLKEKNMLLGQRLEAQVTKEREVFPHPHRLVKVKKSMARIKLVLSEREKIVEQARQYVKELYAKQQPPSQ